MEICSVNNDYKYFHGSESSITTSIRRSVPVRYIQRKLHFCVRFQYITRKMLLNKVPLIFIFLKKKVLQRALTSIIKSLNMKYEIPSTLGAGPTDQRTTRRSR